MESYVPRPSVLKSLDNLKKTISKLPQTETLPVESVGVTYAMAQELAWIDLQHFAVGRWDGSMSIFQFTQSQQQGPLITEVVNTPSAEGIQMIVWLAPNVFATSNDTKSVIVWTSGSGNWKDLSIIQILEFDRLLGVANSGTSYITPDDSALYFIVGHANGFVSIWQGNFDGTDLKQTATVDVHSTKPVNPWGLHNIRGISIISWDSQFGYAISGSEDGDLCIFRIPDGVILSRTTYNLNAQRGINSISVLEKKLLVANCAVGANDKNLWYFEINLNDWSLQLIDSFILKVDSSLPQVFNFDVVWGCYSGGICWFSATEEGILWMGTISNESFLIIGYQQITAKLGAAIAMNLKGNLALAAYDLYEFNTSPSHKLIGVKGHPERFVITNLETKKSD